MKSKNPFFISDTFFGRTNIIDLYDRPYSSIEDMNKSLVNNWNKAVSNSDTVFHLGNFAWEPNIAHEILSSLNGNIFIVPGESDAALLEIGDTLDHITILDDQILMIDELDLVISHWELADWPGRELGTIHIHGGETAIGERNKINARCDFWNYSPVELKIMKEFIYE